MKEVVIRWIIVFIYCALIIIAILEADLLTIVTTVLMTIAVTSFFFGYTSSKKSIWLTVGFISGLLALAGFVYRIVLISSQH